MKNCDRTSNKSKRHVIGRLAILLGILLMIYIGSYATLRVTGAYTRHGWFFNLHSQGQLFREEGAGWKDQEIQANSFDFFLPMYQPLVSIEFKAWQEWGPEPNG